MPRPSCKGKSLILPHLKRLPKVLPAVKLNFEETAGFQLKIHRYASDMGLPAMTKETRVDEWWNHVQKARGTERSSGLYDKQRWKGCTIFTRTTHLRVREREKMPLLLQPFTADLESRESTYRC